jgi:CBS-domain-containing membrane protein
MNIVAFLRCYSPSSMFPRILNLNSTLDETITSMLANSTHHLWVVNKDYVPIGCVSLTDLIRILMSIAEKPL